MRENGLRRRGFQPGLWAWAAALCLAAAPPVLAQQQGQSANLTMTVGFRGVMMITNLSASSGPAAGQITLQWTAPAYTGSSLPLTYVVRVSTLANIVDPPTFAAAQPLSVFSASAIPAVASSGTVQSMIVANLAPNIVYYFALQAYDSGSPQSGGGWYRVAARNINVNNFASPPAPRAPQAPFGVGIATGPATATLSWLPVVRFADFGGFANPNAPAPLELTGYAVFRATSPTLGSWTQMAAVSTTTLNWTDNASGPQYYYFVQSMNNSAVSARSAVRAAATGDMYVVAPDDQSYYYIPSALTGPLTGVGNNPASAYAIFPSSNPQDLGGLNGRIVKSLSFIAYQGGATENDQFALSGMGMVGLHYAYTGSSVTPSALRAAAVPAVPQNMNVYWNNGVNWLQLYANLDSVGQNMTLQTKYFGGYQLRTVERPTSFSFNTAGISNRFLTPNGDGKNDTVVFTYNNPEDSNVTISIYDMHGGLVIGGLPAGPVANSQQWDGRSNGHVVPGGVYIYQIKSEGQVYTGTIVVIR